MIVTSSVATSAAGHASQNPVTPKNFGRVRSAMHKQPRQRRSESVMEITPFERDVNRALPNMLKPTMAVPDRNSRYPSMEIVWISSPGEKNSETAGPFNKKISEKHNTEKNAVTSRQSRNVLCRACLFCAP